MHTGCSMFHQIADLGWVDFDIGSFSICPILPRQMAFWQNWLSNWAGWWNIPNLSHSNPSPQADEHLVELRKAFPAEGGREGGKRRGRD